MRHYLIQRHYIGDSHTLAEFENGVDGLLEADAIVENMELPVRLGLKLTIARDKLRTTPEGRSVLHQAITQRRRLDNSDLLIQEDPYDLGSGTSFRQIFCNPIFFSPKTDAGVVLNLDMDQYPIDTPERLGAAIGFADQVVADDALLGIGSRSVAAKLGVNDRASDLRAIDELVHTLCVGPGRLRAPNPPAGVTPAYAAIGESTSGFAALNTRHPEYYTLQQKIMVASERADLSGFAADYYLTLAASQIGHLTAGYVSTRTNRFYGTPTPEQELAAVERTIFSQTQQLSKTDVRSLLMRMEDERTMFLETLSRFYPREDVEYILNLKTRAIET